MISTSAMPFMTLNVPAGTKYAYLNSDVWRDFGTILMPGKEILDSDVSIANDVDTEYEQLTYKRKFGTTNFQCLYVPMAINIADIEDEFDVYKLGAVFLFDNDGDGAYYGDGDESYVRIFKVRSGILKPNTPYYIKAKATGEKVIPSYDNVLYASEENSFESSTFETTSTIYGNYTKHAIGQEFFTISGGSLSKMKSTVSLGAFRWYLLITDKDGFVMDLPNHAKIRIVSDDDEDATAIDERIASMEKRIKTIYSVNGASQSNLRHGINIIRYSDGTNKKVFVK